MANRIIKVTSLALAKGRKRKYGQVRNSGSVTAVRASRKIDGRPFGWPASIANRKRCRCAHAKRSKSFDSRAHRTAACRCCQADSRFPARQPITPIVDSNCERRLDVRFELSNWVSGSASDVWSVSASVYANKMRYLTSASRASLRS
jgi:hypothetical protein